MQFPYTQLISQVVPGYYSVAILLHHKKQWSLAIMPAHVFLEGAWNHVLYSLLECRTLDNWWSLVDRQHTAEDVPDSLHRQLQWTWMLGGPMSIARIYSILDALHLHKNPGVVDVRHSLESTRHREVLSSLSWFDLRREETHYFWQQQKGTTR